MTSNLKIDLLDTIPAKDWLSQFQKSDIDIAKFLLNSIIFVSNNDFIRGIQSLINNFLKNHSGVVALFAARKVVDNKPYFHNITKRPLSINAQMMVGSEGIVANLCRDLSVSNSHRILDHPSINTMRKRKCRWLLCLDDILASGWRLSRFTNWLYDDPHIKSWASFNWIKFVSITYGATLSGICYSNITSRISDNKYFQSSSAGRSTWTEKQKMDVEHLCNRYAKYTSSPDKPLGHEDIFTLTVFQHKCPNTAPAILWASKENSWFGLFSERPELVLDQWPSKNKQDLQDETLKPLGQGYLTTSSIFHKLNCRSKNIILLLACLSKRKIHEHILSDMLQLSIPKISIMLARCEEYGWISKERYLTKAGRNVLKAAKKMNFFPSMKIEIKNEFYYPKTLRSPARSSSLVPPTGDNHGCQA